MMDQQLFDMIRSRFDNIDTKLDAAKESFDSHAATDASYWKVLDEQQTQISLIKRMFWGGMSLATTIGTYLGLRH